MGVEAAVGPHPWPHRSAPAPVHAGSGRRHGRCCRARSRDIRPVLDIAGRRYSRGGALPPWPVHRSRRVQVDGRGESPGPAPAAQARQQLAAHAVELTDMPPPEAAQERPQRLDQQPRTRPCAQRIGVVESPPASRKRPASACPQCSPVPARRRGQGDGQRVPAGPGRARVAGRSRPALATRRWSQRGCGYGRDCSGIYCSLFHGRVLFQNHYPRFRGAPNSFFKGCPKGRPSVDSG